MPQKQISLFENDRLDLEASIQLSLISLSEYGSRYRHWAIAYSGGKDSTATVTFITWAIKNDLVPKPDTLNILYADTRMELPPLQATALKLLAALDSENFSTEVVSPVIDDRFYVYILGRGVPPPKNRFRWCTPQIKVEPMLRALQSLRDRSNEKLLMLTGVRIGESAARDQRIALSCSRDSGECGQGWFQHSSSDAIADTLAPLAHWRLCHVYDWLYFEQPRHGYDVSGIAAVYGDEEMRTGCIGCNLVNKDTMLERLIKFPEWEHLSPLLELKPLYRELKKAKWRKRKAEAEMRQDGPYGKNAQRLGPLTMDARKMGLEKVLDIQSRAQVDLINVEEHSRILELWSLDTWPQKWSADDIDGDKPIDAISIEDNQLIIQPLLIK